MRAKKAKAIRKIAKNLTGTLETSYSIINNPKGARHRQIFVDKYCFRGVVKKVKKVFKTSKGKSNVKFS